MSSLCKNLGLVLLLLAVVVILYGAYVRLTDAGLGCPDWPGCYGQLTAPSPDKPTVVEDSPLVFDAVEIGKAWREMIHRYLASALGFGILVLALLTWTVRRKNRHSSKVPYILLPLVVFQGVLGMWTVTLLLKPLVVTAHLLGGLATLSILYWYFLSCRYAVAVVPQDKKLNILAWFGLFIVVSQVFLGGWTSTNYAALACTELPRCHGLWLPLEQLDSAFVLWRGLGVNYEFGVLDTPARVSIHVVHRIGAVVVTLVLGFLVWRTLRCELSQVRKIGLAIGSALLLQLSLGIANVLGGLPIFVAVGHNGGAGLLLLTIVSLIYFTSRRDAHGL